MPIETVQVLNGHIDVATAYLVEDYPYGYTLRCQIRYWIDTAAKGSHKGHMRFVSQTTNPKVVGTVWNKPKASTYSPLKVMYLDGKGHVHSTGADHYLSPVGDARLRLAGIVGQLTAADQARYLELLAISQQYRPPWDEWQERLSEIAAHIRATGTDPDITDGRFTTADGRGHYLGDNAEIYLTCARQRLGETP